MRIISGKYRGRILETFKLSSTRPTGDMVRESLFNILGTRVLNCNFLDLFAGTGAVGIEALSRGAKTCYFVDDNRIATDLTAKNLNKISADTSKILNLHFSFALSYFKNNGITFDIIFLDPPYNSTFAEESIDKILTYGLLAKSGVLVWEHDREKLKTLEKFKSVKTKKYGIKYLSLIESENLSNQS